MYNDTMNPKERCFLPAALTELVPPSLCFMFVGNELGGSRGLCRSRVGDGG